MLTKWGAERARNDKKGNGMTELRAGSNLASPSASPAASVPSEDRLTGARLLRQAFREAGQHTAHRAEVIIFAQDPDPPALMIQHGTAYSSHAFRDGRRAIIDVFLPPDVVGIEPQKRRLTGSVWGQDFDMLGHDEPKSAPSVPPRG